MRAEEQILIVYSVARTPKADIKVFADAVDAYSSRVARTPYNAPVHTRPRIFTTPPVAPPGETLAVELRGFMDSCVGAIVFVDDLRPNIAYELGYFHGRGHAVLLVCKEKDIDAVWLSISDLAGCALLRLGDATDVATEVARYLDRVYSRLADVRPWQTLRLPVKDDNQLGREVAVPEPWLVTLDEGPFGSLLRWSSWQNCDLQVHRNVLAGARFRIALRFAPLPARTGAPTVDYAIYFRVRCRVSDGSSYEIWLGVASWRVEAGLHSDERLLPGPALSEGWQLLTGSFEELMAEANVRGTVERLDWIRVRAGKQDPARRLPEVVPPISDAEASIEVGFVRVSGLD